MQITIYDKTDKGREEIATRKWQLPSRMRSLLVLIDGKKSDAEIVRSIGGLGLSLKNLEELQQLAFIQRVAVEADQIAQDLDLTKDEQNVNLDSNTLGNIDALEEAQTIFEPSPDEDDSWNADLDRMLSDDHDEQKKTRVDMMKTYLGDNIKSHLGFKGFFMQRKLQKMQTLDDLHRFRQDYVSAILHAKGKDLAITLRDQFDQRMYVRFSLDSPEFLDEFID